MRMSCNGCRVLRKGCSEDCSIRPCLQWIKSPESQANATVFLAKFYGRSGLVKLVDAGPAHLRPAIFRSLLYEACGRIVDPIYGSVGLLWSGGWPLCQAAVEAVLDGAPVVPISSDAAASTPPPPLLKAYDIRHVFKDAAAAELHRVIKPRHWFKRCGAKHPTHPEAPPPPTAADNESTSSADTLEAASHVSLAGKPGRDKAKEDSDEVGLEQLRAELNPQLHSGAAGGRRLIHNPHYITPKEAGRRDDRSRVFFSLSLSVIHLAASRSSPSTDHL
ncbi:LOB domain-containing protein 41-like [Curcuma longa]|uniref:LOB domain-containing protein 41-like n=1 Tax=Curcuma longa TaxID=136217 RepID=UPI003D9F0BBD